MKKCKTKKMPKKVSKVAPRKMAMKLGALKKKK
jgi:hypothetical protein